MATPREQRKLSTNTSNPSISKQGEQIYLLCRYAAQSGLYNSWMDKATYPCVTVTENPANWNVPDDAGIVVTHEHFRWEEVSALRRIYERSRVPILVLADGILEYRNTWQNPTIPDGSIYQPLLAHKIACIGSNSARMIESWGNAGKIEVVGLPRFDEYGEAIKVPTPSNQFHLLVATATTPAFTPEQRKRVKQSLESIKSWCESTTEVEGRSLCVHWRLTDGLSQELEIPEEENPDQLRETLFRMDAAITTPSTIFLESLLADLPTAILDFSNSPPFISSAWSITAPEHLAPVIRELANPPAAKLHYQKYILNDNLRCDSPATTRMVELIDQMIAIGKSSRLGHQALTFPDVIIPPPTRLSVPLNHSELYPENPVMQNCDAVRLQAELSQAVARLGSLPQEIADKNRQITQLQSALDESRRRVADVRSRLFKLRKILGIGKENQTEESAGRKE